MLIPFQSHAGSIEAFALASLSASGGVFQSHAGSIEAYNDFTLEQRVASSFNPTLVRLRRRLRGRGEGGSAWFQSHAGSIEATLVACTSVTP